MPLRGSTPARGGSTRGGRGRGGQGRGRGTATVATLPQLKMNWTWDKQTLLNGPPVDRRTENSPFYDPSWGIDLDYEQLYRWVWSTLEAFGMPMNLICAFFDILQDSGKTNRPQTLLSNVLNSLARFRLPGTEDRNSSLFKNSLVTYWKTLDWWYAQPANSAAEYVQAHEMMAPATGSRTEPFRGATLDLVKRIVAKWRTYLPFTTDDEVATFILRFESSDPLRDRFRLAQDILIATIGYKTRRIRLSLTAGDTQLEVSRVIRHLQTSVLLGEILPDTTFPRDAEVRLAKRRCLQTDAEAREGLLKAWATVRGREDLTNGDFEVMRADLIAMKRAPRNESGDFFARLAREILPWSSQAERESLTRGIQQYAAGETLGVRAVMKWDPSTDVILLKQVLEQGQRDGTDLGKALRRYDLHPSAAASIKRVNKLLKCPGVPALDMLRRSCPHWWKAMILGDDTAVALNLLTTQKFTPGEQGADADANPAEAYEGIVDELAHCTGG